MAKKSPAAGTEISFQSRMENWAAGMDYCAIPVPASVTRTLGTKAAVLVMAHINKSAPFKVSVSPVGSGRHYIRIRKKIRTAANLQEGDRVKVHLRVLDRELDSAIPNDLEKALRGEGVLDDFTAIPPGARNYILRRIEEAARSGTREKRILDAVEAARQRRTKGIDG